MSLPLNVKSYMTFLNLISVMVQVFFIFSIFFFLIFRFPDFTIYSSPALEHFSLLLKHQGIDLSGQPTAPCCYLNKLHKPQKWVCTTVGCILAASLELLSYCHNVASVSLFCRYDCGT